MEQQEINIVLQYFTSYHKGKYIDAFWMGEPMISTQYYHNECDWFQIMIFENNELYQINTEHEMYGIELKTIDDLKQRFKSFTGEELSNIQIEN
jgi:hypothetical protein